VFNMRAKFENFFNRSHHITSHHIEKTEAGLKGLYIREITTVIDLLICYY